MRENMDQKNSKYEHFSRSELSETNKEQEILDFLNKFLDFLAYYHERTFKF